MTELRKIVICGVGLIGGSFGLAQKSAGVAEVVGIGRSRASLEEAVRRGAIDRPAEDWAGALDGADLVLLATPVGQMEAVMRQLAPHLSPGTLVTDGGSTKQDVIAAARRALGDKIGQFVPGHPIAGAEKSGVAAATADLYQGKRVVLTPLPENPPGTVAAVRAAWEACGAVVSELAPRAHDRTFAAVSHLPHLLAFALVHEFAGREDSGQLFGFAAGGFRDFTRIASSHPEMWRDICIANRAPLIVELDAYLAELLRVRVLLASSDGAGLEALFGRARAMRDAWLESVEPPGE
ncbi:MAG TPA: prephenate dehydrogenase/arogenate dehydrogenase family protein [Rhodocyclaceae bacterium]|nr:prephenate dehydrogenase/arogenate dehydrogenase family protein [Rhodocyclaceae bacterium]